MDKKTEAANPDEFLERLKMGDVPRQVDLPSYTFEEWDKFKRDEAEIKKARKLSRIRESQADLGFSAAEMADLLGLNFETYRGYLKGRGTIPDKVMDDLDDLLEIRMGIGTDQFIQQFKRGLFEQLRLLKTWLFVSSNKDDDDDDDQSSNKKG